MTQAYRASRARFVRLTARGPLKFYRTDLLADADRAFSAISQVGRPVAAVKSVAAREAEKRGQKGAVSKPPVRSSITGSARLSGQPVKLHRRQVDQVRETKPDVSEAQKQRQALAEDAFCREVLYRLEGDLLRFDSRAELLLISGRMGIGLFRANLLMAQIVESVRQHKLYEPSGEESALSPTPASSEGEAPGFAWKWLWISAGAAVLILDALLIAVQLSG